MKKNKQYLISMSPEQAEAIKMFGLFPDEFKNPYRPGDRVRLTTDLKDEYSEVCMLRGTVKEVEKLHEDGEGLWLKASNGRGVHYSCVERADD